MKCLMFIFFALFLTACNIETAIYCQSDEIKMLENELSGHLQNEIINEVEWDLNIYIAQYIVRKIYEDYHDAMGLIAPGLMHLANLQWVSDQIVGGSPITIYNDLRYVPIVNSRFLPHITSVKCIAQEFKKIFTEYAFNKHFHDILFNEFMPLYMDIEGVLHRLDVDYPSMFNWMHCYIEIIDLTNDSFIAIVPRWRNIDILDPFDELDNMRLNFVYTKDGWRIDDLGFVYFETYYRLHELEHYIFSLLNDINIMEINWTIAVLNKSSNIVTTVGNIYAPIDWLSHTTMNKHNQLYVLDISAEDVGRAVSLLDIIHENPAVSVLVNAIARNSETACAEVISYASYVTDRINNFIHGRSVDDRYFVAIDDIAYLLGLSGGIVYFGRPTCLACRQLVPQLFSIASTMQVRVYYFNTDRWRGNDCFNDVLNKFDVTSVPLIIDINQNGLFVIDDLHSHLSE